MTDVDICNIALSCLGEAGNITSLDPPEGSTEADHCARFLPIAKQELLESFPWSFAIKCERLAQYAQNEGDKWYDFAVPTDCVRLVNVLRHEYTPVCYHEDILQFSLLRRGNSTVIRTAFKSPFAVYVSDDPSPDMYSATFIQALAWLLASKIAGSIHGGDTGMKLSQNALAQARYFAEMAKVQDANQTRDNPVYENELTGFNQDWSTHV